MRVFLLLLVPVILKLAQIVINDFMARFEVWNEQHQLEKREELRRSKQRSSNEDHDNDD